MKTSVLCMDEYENFTERKPIVKKLVATLLAILYIFTLAACSAGGTFLSGNTKVVTDMLGREVRIPEHPERIACMYASTAHMTALMGEGDKIVACADGITRDALMLEKYPGIENTSTPYKEGAINIEELAALQPDLVLIRTEMYDRDSEREKLDKIGVPYLVVDYYSIDELKTAIKIVGEVFGKSDVADAYLKFMDETFSYVEDRVKEIPDSEKVSVYHSLNQATCTDIVGSFPAEIFEKAGVKNASVEVGTRDTGKSTIITLEEIYKWDADAIVCNEYSVTNYILSQRKWAELKAVKNKCVYTLPIGATRWCHHGSIEPQMGVLFLAQLFYPEKFDDLELEKFTHDYYLQFFELDFDEETIEKILTGHGMRESSSNLVFE